ncbi:MAG: NAD(P)-dependent oxidoreductase, partial [Candidatus Fimenecus sp.]
MTEKKKAILLTAEAHNAERVYAENILSVLKDRYAVYDTVLCKKNIDKHKKAAESAEYIFSTWGMEPFSEAEIKQYFPNAKCLFYAAGSVQHFAEAFLSCGIRVFSAWKANAVPVAEYTYAQILLATKGFYRASANARMQYYKMAKYADCCGGNYRAKIGIIGVGSIGSAVAEKLQANEVAVYYYDPFLPKETAEKLHIQEATL